MQNEQVNQTDLNVEGQRLIGAGHNALGRHEHFGHGDVRGQRGILDHGDQRTGQRGEGRAQRLRQDDAADDL